MYLLTVTVPGRETRPRSFRPRSTSMMCSARSFGSRWSCSERIASSAGVAPRGRVPAIGWVVSLSPSTWRSSSGDAPTTSNDGTRTKNRYGPGLTRRRDRYSPIPSSCWPAGGAAGDPRHPLAGLDFAGRPEGANRLGGVERGSRGGGQARVVGIDAQWALLDHPPAVPDLEQPPRPDAEERVPPEPLAALDR